jgi:hypothetical protein
MMKAALETSLDPSPLVMHQQMPLLAASKLEMDFISQHKQEHKACHHNNQASQISIQSVQVHQ